MYINIYMCEVYHCGAFVTEGICGRSALGVANYIMTRLMQPFDFVLWKNTHII